MHINTSIYVFFSFFHLKFTSISEVHHNTSNSNSFTEFILAFLLSLFVVPFSNSEKPDLHLLVFSTSETSPPQ